MCIKGTTTTHLRSRWGRVETEVSFLTTLQRPVTGQLADVAIQMF
jgi:hypothetical protein